MYYTPGWDMPATSVVGVVGVAGTLTAAWFTQRYTDVRFEKDLAPQTSRFERERRDRHYHDQRQAIAEVLAVANRMRLNGHRIATWTQKRSDADHESAASAGEEMLADIVAWPVAVAAAQLIIGDAEVLKCLAEMEAVLAQLQKTISAIDEFDNQPKQWSEAVQAATSAVYQSSRRLTSVTRQRFWSDQA